VTPRLRTADIIQRDIILRARTQQRHCCDERPEASGSLPARMRTAAVVIAMIIVWN